MTSLAIRVPNKTCDNVCNSKSKSPKSPHSIFVRTRYMDNDVECETITVSNKFKSQFKTAETRPVFQYPIYDEAMFYIDIPKYCLMIELIDDVIAYLDEEPEPIISESGKGITMKDLIKAMVKRDNRDLRGMGKSEAYNEHSTLVGFWREGNTFVPIYE